MSRNVFCRHAISSGACSLARCPFRHDVRHCETCAIFLDPQNWAAHVATVRHQRGVFLQARAPAPPRLSTSPNPAPTTMTPVSSPSPRSRRPRRNPPRAVNAQRPNPGAVPAVTCNVCELVLEAGVTYEAHALTPHHQEAHARNAASTAPTYVLCTTCDESVLESSMDSHNTSRKHVRLEESKHMRDNLEYAQDDKYGVTVSKRDGIDFGIIDTDSPRASNTISTTITVGKAEPDARVIFTRVEISSYMPGDRSEDSFKATILGRKGWVRQHPMSVEVVLSPGYEGRHRALLELVFRDIAGDRPFRIVRRLEALVGLKDDHEVLKPLCPWEGPVILPPAPKNDEIHPGRPPLLRSQTKWLTRLPEFKIPLDLVEVAFGGDPNKLGLVKDNFMPKTFKVSTYGEFFQISLFIEEEKNYLDLGAFNEYGVTLEPIQGNYRLEVKGLAEKRPSVLAGDTILVQYWDSPDTRWYRGSVRRVLAQHVELQFVDAFRPLRGTKFNIRFTLNRMPYRRYHHAVTGIGRGFNLGRVAFPALTRAKPPPSTLDQLDFFNRAIGTNEKQKEVVQRIYMQSPGSGPFVIFGPPGTGKTVTVVEAIRQLLHKDPNARVLACAPSNAAADIIAQRLTILGARNLFRLCSFSRDIASLPRGLEEFVLTSSDNTFAIPPLEELEKFRIIVCTCVASGTLQSVAGLPRGHFNYIFIDEAGQAHEPEAMIAIQAMADNYTNVVLSGDPKQLPPILRSLMAQKLGLRKSYLERMTEISREDKKANVTTFMLEDHYRSHPEIIDFSNNEFYYKKLNYCADPVVTDSLLRFDLLPTPNFPIIFHAMTGKDEREGRSPSFFNPSEASLVKTYVEALLGDRRFRLTIDNIGIISPYHAQCSKIRGILKGKLAGIKIGSVEEFQGQERRVIIISTVRSSVKFLEYDLRHNLGFVGDERRFNVAVTRAQALLIIIGDPKVLSLDPTWRKFLNRVQEKGGWKGRTIDWNEKEPVVPSGYDEIRRRDGRTALHEIVERAGGKVEEGDSDNLRDEDAGYADQPFREID